MVRHAALFVLLAAAGIAHADEVQVAVAANFAAPMKDIAAKFEQDTGHKVLSTVGSTGKFYAQIKNGAPFEILLAADDETPARLEKEGAAVPNTRFTYAIGKLVLWSAQPGLVDDKGEVLKKAGFEHLSIANPKLAPYGAAAVEAMQKLNVYSALEPKFVVGESIAQAHQFVVVRRRAAGICRHVAGLRRRQAEIGFGLGRARHLYSPIRQDAVALEKGKGKPAVDAFLKYLKGDKAKAVIRSYGYDL